MALTQTALNNCLERCSILKRMNHCMTDATIMNIKNFFTKIRSLEKISSIMQPIEIEYDIRKEAIVFSWLKTVDNYVDMLDIYFREDNYVEIDAVYESLDMDINHNYPYDDEFHEQIVVHLKHFKNNKRKKRYK